MKGLTNITSIDTYQLSKKQIKSLNKIAITGKLKIENTKDFVSEMGFDNREEAEKAFVELDVGKGFVAVLNVLDNENITKRAKTDSVVFNCIY